jgi:hypothetical protein
VLPDKFHFLGGTFKAKVLLAAKTELISHVLACTKAWVHVDERTIAIVAKLVYLGCSLGKLAIFKSGKVRRYGLECTLLGVRGWGLYLLLLWRGVVLRCLGTDKAMGMTIVVQA